MKNHLGGHQFVTHTDGGSLTYLKEELGCETLPDIGCGVGGQLDLAEKIGYIDVLGIDGDTLVKTDKITIFDFCDGKPDLGSYDLGWSCEFLEHIEEKYLDNVVDCFRKCKYIAITHALPNKKGHHHVNCRESSYWLDFFKDNGFEFLVKETLKCRQVSTMKREFFKNTGMVFKRVI